MDVLFMIPLVLASIVARFCVRKVDIGLGPEPLINYLYHKKALVGAAYSAETYVASTYYITAEFDYSAPSLVGPFPNIFRWHLLFFRAIFRYRCLYFSFHGGPLMGAVLLRPLEPYLLKLAGIKTVILPYGSDVQDMNHCPNLAFRNAMAKDYPTVKNSRKKVARQIDRWSRYANHIISGCDWVDYMYHWDTISLAHFSIDTDFWSLANPRKEEASDKTVRILHAPNHKAIKGTDFFVRAIDELREEGLDVELVLLERQPNEKVREVMEGADVIADQLVIGWYAMFAIEGMALGKPVLCYIRDDLRRLYTEAGLIEKDELPLVECSPANVKEVIRSLVSDRQRMREIGDRSRQFVVKHHSLESVGNLFDRINRTIGIVPVEMHQSSK